MLKHIPLIITLAASLTACGGSDNKKSSSSSSVAVSSSSPAASSTPASSTPASSTPASSTPASSEPASSTPASSEPASSTPASSTPASSEPASSSVSSSSSSAAATKLTVDFESDTVGTTYEGASWNPGELTATVVTIASVTGLPVNASSVNVLQVVVGNYNAVPIMEVSLPEGKTLADYNVKVDAYFPRNTLGLTDAGANYYKDFLLLADTTITSGAGDTNPAYHSKIATIWDDVDVWKTYTLTVDPTKGAALTGTIKIAMGLNREAGTNDGYYFDNIRLEPK